MNLLIFGMITAAITWIIAEVIDNNPKKQIPIIEIPTTPPKKLRTILCSSMDLKCKECPHAMFHIPNTDCNHPKKCTRKRIAHCR